MQQELLAWFETNGRDLPWRHTRDPYAILVSEVMLQQTQVDRVVPCWQAWLERWPTVEALAGASTADVIVAWQGLGYNRRAVSLHRAARLVAEHGWPDDLTELPGVGPYTAAAVGNFAFGRDTLAARHERPSCAGADRRDVRRDVRAGLVRPRCDDLPRTHPTVRSVPTRGQVPVARLALRTASQTVALRRLVSRASRAGTSRSRRGRTAEGRRRAHLARPRRARRPARRRRCAARLT